MLVEAVESINRSPLLGNLTLGYRIVDSCSDVTTAVAVTQRFLYDSVCPQEVWKRDGWYNSRPTSPSRPVNVVIGGYHSEISIAVARQLSIHQIPQVKPVRMNVGVIQYICPIRTFYLSNGIVILLYSMYLYDVK